MDWRDSNSTPVYSRKIFDWAVPREKRCCLLLWSGWSSSHSPYLDVLLSSDFPARRRVYLSLMRITMVRSLAKTKSLRLACPRSSWQERKLRVGVKRQLKAFGRKAKIIRPKPSKPNDRFG